MKEYEYIEEIIQSNDYENSVYYNEEWEKAILGILEISNKIFIAYSKTKILELMLSNNNFMDLAEAHSELDEMCSGNFLDGKIPMIIEDDFITIK